MCSLQVHHKQEGSRGALRKTTVEDIELMSSAEMKAIVFQYIPVSENPNFFSFKCAQNAPFQTADYAATAAVALVQTSVGVMPEDTPLDDTGLRIGPPVVAAFLQFEHNEVLPPHPSSGDAAAANAEKVARLEEQLTELRRAITMRSEAAAVAGLDAVAAVQQQPSKAAGGQNLDHLLTQEEDKSALDMLGTSQWDGQQGGRQNNPASAGPQSMSGVVRSGNAAAATLDALIGAVGTLTPERQAGGGDPSTNDEDSDSALQGSDDEATALAEVLNTPERVQQRRTQRFGSTPAAVSYTQSRHENTRREQGDG